MAGNYITESMPLKEILGPYATLLLGLRGEQLCSSKNFLLDVLPHHTCKATEMNDCGLTLLKL